MAVQIENSSWETIKSVSVDTEGIFTYILRPIRNQTLHKLVVDIKLEHKVKVVTLRSPNCIYNYTNINLEFSFTDHVTNKTPVFILLKPGEYYSIPIDATHQEFIYCRPEGNFEFN